MRIASFRHAHQSCSRYGLEHSAAATGSARIDALMGITSGDSSFDPYHYRIPHCSSLVHLLLASVVNSSSRAHCRPADSSPLPSE